MINKLKNLALSETGFAFDPSNGNTYTLNDTGLYIIKALREGIIKEELLKIMQDEYEVSEEELERDITDLLIHLGEYGLWDR